MRQVPDDMVVKLLSAAEALMASFDDIQMSDIAGAVGVARSSLYYYFTNKDDVRSFLLRAMLDELAEATAISARSPGDAPTRLTAVVRTQLEHFDRHPAASYQLVAHLGRATLPADIATYINHCFELPIRRLLVEGAQDGSIRIVSDADLVAAALFGAVLAIGLRFLILDGHIAVDEVMGFIDLILWQGIAPASDRPWAVR